MRKSQAFLTGDRVVLLLAVGVTAGCLLVGHGCAVGDVGDADDAAMGASGGSATADPGGSHTGGTAASGDTGGAAANGDKSGNCVSPNDCPGVDLVCAFRDCSAGNCGTRHALEGTSCSYDGGSKCNGHGQCVQCVDGNDCPEKVCQGFHCVAASCADKKKNGKETDVDCGGDCGPCENGKSCQAPDDCQSKMCRTGTCVACGNDNECAALGAYCASNGECQPKKAEGYSCLSPAQCLSGFCPAQDGVCCLQACAGRCSSCLKAKSGATNGTCAAVIAMTDPDGECTDQGASSCDANGTGCNGNANAPNCRLYSASTPCDAATCQHGAQFEPRVCDGQGVCQAATQTPCAPYTCNASATACLSSCSTTSDCSQGFECDSLQVCSALCTGKLTKCNSDCVDTTSHGLHCGGCNSPCNSGYSCKNSICEAVATQLQHVALGANHSCALTSSGGAKCWGHNNHGQLGDGLTTSSRVPRDVSGLTSGVSAIAAGFYHSCALTSSGGVQCWGRNNFGQLGDGSTTNSSVPKSVSGLTSGVSAIAAHAYHTCALTSSGGVKCWGYNNRGQLGDGSTTNSSVPKGVSGLTSGVSAIAAGFYHSCALASGGSVKCWGHNNYGQLGNGTTTDKHEPFAVAGLTAGVDAVAANGYNTCALKNGSLWCWGNNDYGQLGNGNTTWSLLPVAVSGMGSGVEAIACGAYYSCALVSGVLKCWGKNDSGQLGNNSTTRSLLPADVNGMSANTGDFSTGVSHTCALLTSGGAKCWGSNGYGQLGNGGTKESHIPVDVINF